MRKWLIVSLIILIFICFVVFRIVLPLQSTFTENGVQFNTPDAYYMARYAEVYPNIPELDYFFGYPDGMNPMPQMVFVALVANVSHLLNIDVMTSAAIIPPILMLFALIAVFVICRALFKNILIALVSVFILTIMSGEIMARTMLGAADYHCLEIALFTISVMFVVMAVKSRNNWKWCVSYSVLAAIAIVDYMFAWAGGIMVIFIIGLFLLIWASVKLKWWHNLIIIIGLAVACAGYYLGNTPRFMYYIHNFIDVFVPNIGTVVSEEMPLFFTAGRFDFVPMWNYFGITFYLALFGLGFLIHNYKKYRKPEILLLLVWTVVILAMTFAQRRFAYYLGVNVAIIVAYIMVLVLSKIKTQATVIKASVGLFLVIVVPFARMDVVMADYGRMPKEWQECTAWLKQQANQPQYIEFGGVKVVVDTFAMIEGTNNYRAYMRGDKPDYGVLSWWDYGNWIIVAGRTPALGTPINQDFGIASGILTETDTTEAIDKLKELQLRYVIITDEMFEGELYPIYPILIAAKIDVDMAVFEDMLMYRLFYSNDVEGVGRVWQSGNYKVKVFEVK